MRFLVYGYRDVQRPRIAWYGSFILTPARKPLQAIVSIRQSFVLALLQSQNPRLCGKVAYKWWTMFLVGILFS